MLARVGEAAWNTLEGTISWPGGTRASTPARPRQTDSHGRVRRRTSRRTRARRSARGLGRRGGRRRGVREHKRRRTQLRRKGASGRVGRRKGPPGQPSPRKAVAAPSKTDTGPAPERRGDRRVFSPDGATAAAAAASHGKSCRPWDVSRGQCAAVSKGHSAGLTSVAFSPDGTTAATASYDKSCRLWDVASGRCTATLEGHSGHVSSVAFSPDGVMLATTSDDDKTCRLWDVARGQRVAHVGTGPDGFQIFVQAASGPTITVDVQGPQEPTAALLARIQARLGARLGDVEGHSLTFGGHVLHPDRGGVPVCEWGIGPGSTLVQHPWLVGGGVRPPVGAPAEDPAATPPPRPRPPQPPRAPNS